MTMPTIEEYSRKDDLLMQHVIATMEAHTKSVEALTSMVGELQEKLHGMELSLARNGAQDQGRVDGIEARVSRIERVHAWVAGLAATVIAAILIFWFTTVLKTGIGSK